MKRLFALALCLCLALGGCASGGMETPLQEAPPTEKTREEAPAPSPEIPETMSIEKLALALAELPELPEEPDEAAFWDEINALDYDKLGQEGYRKAYDELWSTFSEKQDAYHEAANALRGEGVDAALTPALSVYTLRTAAQLASDETEKNVVYSPANLYLALCMLAETTNGESRAQLLELLGLSNVEQARAAANALWRNLYRDGARDKTLLANSIWLGEQFDFHQDTVDTLAKDYFASTFSAPMGEKATDDAIHAWINENTNHLLEAAANGLETDPDTLMLLISTLYFKGTWTSQFDAYSTHEDTFTTADGAEQTVDFMHRTDTRRACYRGENFTAAPLYFEDGTTMWFLLPDEGVSVQSILPDANNVNVCIDAPEGTVQNTAFGPILAREEVAEIHWSVPKFDVTSDLDLIPALQALGVTDVFEDAADFSALTDTPAVVSAVEHAARVKVDEEGCEAAAFTDVMVMPTSALIEPLPVVEMDLDRPFGFLITGVSGLPLFMGIVNTTA